ncbi:alpha/beta fold hydrolase [Kitasatospora sp. NPDC085879]|uniref:thioesterase II family protein n=1 Tax=Kitasatospora sp. NPDC085879 TaxID=3154769 RepID=UPI0034456ABD
MLVDTAPTARAARWFPYGPPRPGQGLPLFCLPYAGGGARMFRSWTRLPAEGFQPVPIQLPGREERHGEVPAVRMPDLVADLAQALAPYADGEYALFGHSMGATLAYELAGALVANGAAPPRTLFVSAACAPHLRRIRPDMHLLPEGEFADQIRRLGGTPSQLLDTPGFAELYLPLLRADLELVASHQHTAPARLLPRISAFGGAADRAVEPAAVLAWQRYARHRFRSRILPGGHFFLHDQQAAVLEGIRRDLRDTAEPDGGTR